MKKESFINQEGPAGKRSYNKKQSASNDKKTKKKSSARISFEEHLKVQDAIKKGIDEGVLFEGFMRINPNNRNRAFVSVEGVNIDVMIDGLGAQNRALDGDTVIVQLLNPARWPGLTSSHLVVGAAGGKTTKEGGITNETAIETRIIDDIHERGS